ncbi:hypothetical protein C1N59_18420 [Pantoea sp. SGAir0183]
MILARLHGYKVRALLESLIHADVGNVRFWHRADLLTELKVRYERDIDIKKLRIIAFLKGYACGHES